jgi:hypothetical protein
MRKPETKIISMSPSAVPMWVVVCDLKSVENIEVYLVLALAVVEDYMEEESSYAPFQYMDPVYCKGSVMGSYSYHFSDNKVWILDYLYNEISNEEARRRYSNRLLK